MVPEPPCGRHVAGRAGAPRVPEPPTCQFMMVCGRPACRRTQGRTQRRSRRSQGRRPGPSAFLGPSPKRLCILLPLSSGRVQLPHLTTWTNRPARVCVRVRVGAQSRSALALSAPRSSEPARPRGRARLSRLFGTHRGVARGTASSSFHPDAVGALLRHCRTLSLRAVTRVHVDTRDAI